MNACQTVSKWITENVLVPVEKFLTEAREACEEVKKWVEEQVSQPVENWVSKTERRCKEQSCNWWCLCCNKWFCWLVVLVVKVVTWIVITVGKWVTYLVCKIVTVVVGVIVELVLKIIHRVVTFVVCLFTDPGAAFKALWDLWNDIVDAIGELWDLGISLLDDLIGILQDVKNLIDAVGRSFCIFGDVVCAIATAIFGFFSGIVSWLSDIIDWLRETGQGLKDLLTGILTLNWCKIQGGLRIGNVFRVIGSVTRIPAGWFYSGPEDLVSKAALEGIIDDALAAAFPRDAERLERSRANARLGGSPIGLPLHILPARMAVRSGPFLHRIASSGEINLHALAGRVSDCDGEFIYGAFAGEVVYTGTSTTVSQSDLDWFLGHGPDAVASFTVYPITMDRFRRYLDVARRKGFEIGLNFTWHKPVEVVVDTSTFAPILQSDTNDDTAQRTLLGMLGRPTSNEDLSEVPTIAVFGYRDTSLHGLTSWFRYGSSSGTTTPSPPVSPSGTTFRTRFPEVAFRYVAIHEIGHYFGLDHADHLSPRCIMWSPKAGDIDWGETVAEYVALTGEPIFTEDDARAVWTWITTTPDARDRMLP